MPVPEAKKTWTIEIKETTISSRRVTVIIPQHWEEERIKKEMDPTELVTNSPGKKLLQTPDVFFLNVVEEWLPINHDVMGLGDIGWGEMVCHLDDETAGVRQAMIEAIDEGNVEWAE